MIVQKMGEQKGEFVTRQVSKQTRKKKKMCSTNNYLKRFAIGFVCS